MNPVSFRIPLLARKLKVGLGTAASEGETHGGSDTRRDGNPSSYAPQASSSSHRSFNMTAMADSLNEAESSQKPSQTKLDFLEDDSSVEDFTINEEVIGTVLASSKSSENREIRDWSKEWSDPEDDSKKKPDIVCPTHGIACSKRICKDYKKLEWDQKREEAKKNGQSRGSS